MEIIQGDLIEMIKREKFDLVVHGCNCMCSMSGGIAKQLADNFSEIRKADDITSYGYNSKLGKYSVAVIKNSTIVLNAYTQFLPGANVNYVAITSVFNKINKNFKKFPEANIGLPKIGAGIAGGDWNIIEKIIKRELKDMKNITLVEYNGG